MILGTGKQKAIRGRLFIHETPLFEFERTNTEETKASAIWNESDVSKRGTIIVIVRLSLHCDEVPFSTPSYQHLCSASLDPRPRTSSDPPRFRHR